MSNSYCNFTESLSPIEAFLPHLGVSLLRLDPPKWRIWVFLLVFHSIARVLSRGSKKHGCFSKGAPFGWLKGNPKDTNHCLEGSQGKSWNDHQEFEEPPSPMVPLFGNPHRVHSTKTRPILFPIAPARQGYAPVWATAFKTRIIFYRTSMNNLVWVTLFLPGQVQVALRAEPRTGADLHRAHHRPFGGRSEDVGRARPFGGFLCFCVEGTCCFLVVQGAFCLVLQENQRKATFSGEPLERETRRGQMLIESVCPPPDPQPPPPKTTPPLEPGGSTVGGVSCFPVQIKWLWLKLKAFPKWAVW